MSTLNIYDIAEKAGVSIATVSRVINNQGTVSAKTREKVAGIIQNYNYTPKLASSLNKSKEIVFFTSPQSLLFENSIISGIGEVAFSNKLSIRLCALKDIPRKHSDLQDFISERGIGAAIFTLLPYSEEHYYDLSQLVPSVLLFNRIDSFPVNFIRGDHYKGGYLAIQHLVQMNHRHIGIIDEVNASADHQERLKGVHDALKEFNISTFKEHHLINVAHLTEMDICSQIDHLLEQNPQITALFVANDNFIPGLYRHFRSKEVRIPEDISIIGADDLPGSIDLYPPLTTIRQPVKLMSSKAAQYLIDILTGHHDAAATLQETFDVQLVVRGSTRKI
ncbi:LacI family transcriptional regulator [Paenibacillus psychroresistens]|uniref:LacI family transcriptional regulator n=1 Tax=Paenibacillus psychroresistens TaxID=1778678 RepID=A0A6B8RRY5_9BACL|nr:LacI family DNA-binding transcriptional regulator [Paenibacillus psychroresistens]QGQ98315.1 LacI family transcriptional regulator [Paenibacillus psychroresistens]